MVDESKPPSGLAAVISDGKVVSLPVEPDHFREFISGLLGQPQTIDRRIPGPYELERKDVENLFHLLKQRIERQNEGYLVSFSARIFYTDNSSVLINSITDFMAYAEVKPLTSSGLHLSWTWLVRFQDRTTPEKQDISISFKSSARLNASAILLSQGGLDVPSYYGSILVSISHTDRSWGSDIDTLLSGGLENLRRPPSEFRMSAARYSTQIGFFVGFLSFAIISTGIYKFTHVLTLQAFARDRVAWAGSKLSDLEIIQNKIDYLIRSTSTGSADLTGVWPVLAYLLAIFSAAVIGTLTAENCELRGESYVLLTKQSYDSKVRSENRRKNGISALMIYCVGALILGILGNFASSWLASLLPPR